jgi:hypothetical protein
MATNLVVCESPWTERGLIQPWSMRPFVEGLAEFSGARLVYRTFTSGEELKALLSYEAIDRPTKRTIVYIACHGSGGRLVLGRGEGSAYLAPIALSVRRGVEGVWLGACDVGASRALTMFLSKSGAVWAGGYGCSVDWHPSMLIDLAVLQELILGRVIGALRLFARDRVRGGRVAEVTDLVKQRLGRTPAGTAEDDR